MENREFDREIDRSRIKDECIITQKVYDQCKQQDCLTPAILGSARSAETVACTIGRTGNTQVVNPGAVINLPIGTTKVNIVENSFEVHEVRIGVEPRKFTNDGYWDVSLQYVFSFSLEFFDTTGRLPIVCNGVTEDSICAEVIYDKLVPLFGSTTKDFIIASNLFNPATNTLENKPYVWVEAQAMPLDYKLINVLTPAPHLEINITVGLFTIIKLFRFVNLMVKSKGFCKPKTCVNVTTDPCDYFDNLKFPFDIFNPPQKEDYGNREEEEEEPEWIDNN